MIYGHPPLIEFSSFLIKLEYHVNLCCLHLHQYATVARPYYNLAFALPLTVERRRGRPTGSVRVNISTSHEPSASEQNTGYTTCGRGRRRRRGCGRGRVGGRRREHELARRCSS